MNTGCAKWQKNLKKIGLISALTLIVKSWKMSFIVGSQHAFFSTASLCGPLSVVFGGVPGGCIFLLLNQFGVTLTNFWLLKTGLPAMLAGLYWRTESKTVRSLLPLLAMVIFGWQTWGTMGMYYAALWLIPLVIAQLQLTQAWWLAVGATFVAHSTGSILWLYGAQMTQWQWFGLIPVALAERVALATMMWVMYHSINLISELIMCRGISRIEFLHGVKGTGR